jgi:hypothetical protein
MYWVLGDVASEALDLIGFYYSGKPKVKKRRSTQQGIYISSSSVYNFV